MSERVLIVDDDPDFGALIQASLESRGFEVERATYAEQAIEWVGTRDYDAVLTDVQMGNDDGIELCIAIKELRPSTPVIIMTAYGDMEVAVRAIRAGAYDFITKPCKIEAMVLILRRALELFSLKEEVRRLREASQDKPEFAQLIGDCRPMRRVYDLIDRVAQAEGAVLITGESGTGKELVARAIHARSSRADQAFVAINCAAMPASLLESELFGHVKGAFTDAVSDREGLFVKASGGTLFLDEIGEMPAAMQAKLLRVLQERKLRPVGADHEISFDTRIVSATNRDLEEDIENGHFREDLYYRVHVVKIDLPPLRMRGNDILVLAQRFLKRAAERNDKAVIGLAAPTAQKLMTYDWPGNVRELEHVMERAVTLTRLEQLGVEDLPEKIRSHTSSRMVLGGDDPDTMPSLEEVERRYIRSVLAAVRGNKSHAARVLGMDRRTLYRKLERLEEDASPPG